MSPTAPLKWYSSSPGQIHALQEPLYPWNLAESGGFRAVRGSRLQEVSVNHHNPGIAKLLFEYKSAYPLKNIHFDSNANNFSFK